MARMPTPRSTRVSLKDLETATAALRHLLARVEDGRMSAPSEYIAMLHGALIAIDTEVSLGGGSNTEPRTSNAP